MQKITKVLSGTFFYCLLTSTGLFAQTGTWSKVKTLAPHFNEGTCLLMTDGTVICHNNKGRTYGTGWDRLTPDIHGSYANGTWDTIRSMNYDRFVFASQVLPSGKVYVAGAEYGSGVSLNDSFHSGEVYDPATNTWTISFVPNGWELGEGSSQLLYNGDVIESPINGPTKPGYNCLIWNHNTMNYSACANSLYNQYETTWPKLPDSSVLFIGMQTDSSNRYIPQTGSWVYDALTPVNIFSNEEQGAALLLPNKKVVFFGATPANVIYTPSGNSSPGTWAVTDSFPKQIGYDYFCQSDAPAAMMVNGHILCAVVSYFNQQGPPTWFLEYDYTTGHFTRVADTIPGMGGNDSIPLNTFNIQMLDLPDGNVLVSMNCHNTSSYSKSYLIYTPGSGPIPQGKPTIEGITKMSCNKYMITGKLFNGISEGASYGDDFQNATNYPLVRIENAGNVYYCTTSNWNRIGAVATDSAEDTAYFTVPTVPGGSYQLYVVANGFASNPYPFTTYGASISAITNLPCDSNSSGSISALAACGVSPYTYSWVPSGGTSATASGLSAGTYTCTVIDSAGCMLTISATITQPAVLTASTFVKPNSGPPCNGKTAVTPSGGTPPYTYLWSPGGQTTDTIKNQCNGTYCCTITDSHGCTKNACLSILTGINKMSGENDDIVIYPIPNKGTFTIELKHPVSDGLIIEIYNVLGERVYNEQRKQVQASYQVNIANQPSGVYFLRVLSTDGALLGEAKVEIER